MLHFLSITKKRTQLRMLFVLCTIPYLKPRWNILCPKSLNWVKWNCSHYLWMFLSGYFGQPKKEFVSCLYFCSYSLHPLILHLWIRALWLTVDLKHKFHYATNLTFCKKLSKNSLAWEPYFMHHWARLIPWMRQKKYQISKMNG